MGPEPLVWRARDIEWRIDRTLVMGVLNVTPDSFLDAREHFEEGAAIAHGLRLADEGADILDIGGESTRPGARPVEAEEEWRRIGGVIAAIDRKSDVPISVDTYKPEIARKAIRAGAVVVNDVHGLRDPEMVRVVSNSGAGAVILHMKGEPATMNEDPQYGDVVAEVRAFLVRRMASAIAGGVAGETIVLDPGFGFGKAPEQNAALLRRLGELRGMERPILVGVSGKSFPRKAFAKADPRLREASLAPVAVAVLAGADIVRVHDVGATVPFVRTLDALANRLRNPEVL
jgi:dihydropteroate synthase